MLVNIINKIKDYVVIKNSYNQKGIGFRKTIGKIISFDKLKPVISNLRTNLPQNPSPQPTKKGGV